MRAIQFMFYNSSLVLKEVPKISLNKANPSSKSKYLVKVHYSPINPSDLGFIAGVYGRYQDGIFPKTAGFEGSGIIEDAETEEGKKLIGKKVAFFSNYENQYFSGAWTDYTVVGDKEKIVLPDEFNLKDCCYLMINPLTALSFLELAKTHKSTSIIHSAGASSVGRMITKLFKKNKIDLINTVRKEKHIDELREIGGEFTVLSTNYEDLKKDLKALADKLKPNLAFECVGGDMTGIVLASIKENGFLYHYGNLSLRAVSNVQTRDLLFKNKTIKGFWLPAYLNSLPEKSLHSIMKDLIEIKSNTDLFNTKIVEVFKPKDVESAIKNYRKEMGKGKIILDFIS